jgi:putative oxidoreductase
MNAMTGLVKFVFDQLNIAGGFLPHLGLRFLLAYEFWESGVEKFTGENWFGTIRLEFPFPFNHVPVEISWFLSTWSELLGAVCLVIGLGTRFWALSLIILDIVAWYSVHAGNGYNVCDNGFKLPLIYLVMLLPLFFSGPGKASLDHMVAGKFGYT